MANERKPSRRAEREASKNVYEALGGKEALLEVLAHSAKPEVRSLHDMLLDPQYASRSFETNYKTAGLTLADVVDIFREVQHAKAVVAGLSKAPQLVNDLALTAESKEVPCPKCFGEGEWETKSGDWKPCKVCGTTGTITTKVDIDALDLFFNITGLKKGQAMFQQTFNQTSQTLNVHGGAPQLAAANLIKQVESLTAAQPRLQLPSPAPETAVLEADLVVDETSADMVNPNLASFPEDSSEEPK